MNNTSLITYAQLIGYNDKLAMLRGLLSFPLSNWVMQFFTRTRDAEVQLFFVETCREIIKQNEDKLDTVELERFDRVLIAHELDAYDRLNLWDDYICLFDETRREKPYLLAYDTSRDDPAFNAYAVAQDNDRKYVHFLYLTDHRYQIICRKQKRREEGKPTKHLERHQKSNLSAEDLNARYIALGKLFEHIKRCRAR